MAKSLLTRSNVLDWRTLVLALVCWCAGAAIFFRFPLLSGFQLITAGIGDNRQMILLHEHLFQALTGHAAFLSPAFFYPYPHALGLGDAFVLDLIPYAAFRSLGFDQFLAYQLTVIALSLLCFMATLALGVRYLGLRPAFGIAAAALVTFPNNLYFKIGGGHVQFFAVYYVPALVLLALEALDNFPRITASSTMRAGSAAMLLALLFATGYYTAWFFAFTAAIAACTFLALQRRIAVAYLQKYRRPAGMLCGAAVTGFIVGLVPFAFIYLPALGDSPAGTGFALRAYTTFTWFPQDIINVSPWNLAWGWLMSRLPLKAGAESALAVTPGMVTILIALVYVRRQRLAQFETLDWQTTFGLCCLVTWFLSWLLTFRIGTASAFWLVRELVPGATAIRAGTRVALLVNGWVALAVAVLLQYWSEAAPLERRRRRRLLAIGALAFCLFEQVNLLDNAQLPRHKDLEELAGVPDPPPQCRAFLVSPDQHSTFDVDQIDAFEIAQKVGVPTINGWAPWWPGGWRFLDPGIGYSDAARQWIEATGMKGQVCLYDRSARQWSDFS